MPSSKNPQWEKERKAAKATQVAFDVGSETQTVIKKLAVDNQLTPSDQVRQILSLPVKSRAVRPRLTLSLSEQDFIDLAERYGIDDSERIIIKEKAAEELITFAYDLKKQ